MLEQAEDQERGQRPLESIESRAIRLGLDITGSEAIELVVDRFQLVTILGEEITATGGVGDGSERLLVELLLAG